MYASLLPLSTSVVPTNGFWLDTYYWTCIMLGSARSCTWPMVFPGQGEATGWAMRSGVFKKSITSQVHNRIYAPLHPCPHSRVSANITYCTTTHWRIWYQVKPGPAHEPWLPSSKQMTEGSTGCYWRGFLFLVWVLGCWT